MAVLVSGPPTQIMFCLRNPGVGKFASCACRGKDNQAVGVEAIIAPLDKLQPTPPLNFLVIRARKFKVYNILALLSYTNGADDDRSLIERSIKLHPAPSQLFSSFALGNQKCNITLHSWPYLKGSSRDSNVTTTIQGRTHTNNNTQQHSRRHQKRQRHPALAYDHTRKEKVQGNDEASPI